MPHDIDEMVSIPIKHGKDDVLQLLIKRESIKDPIINAYFVETD